MGTHYEILPIPAMMQYTKLFDAGAVRLGVEYRLLNDSTASTTIPTITTSLLARAVRRSWSSIRSPAAR